MNALDEPKLPNAIEAQDDDAKFPKRLNKVKNELETRFASLFVAIHTSVKRNVGSFSYFINVRRLRIYHLHHRYCQPFPIASIYEMH